MTRLMPKFQSEMQSASYLPVCSITKDLPAIDSSRTWPQNNIDQVQINGHGYNNLYPPCNTSQLQDHEKEMIKKSMLEHEATFKHQVNELHRVYGRQRELMDEIKIKGLTTNKNEGKTSNSNPIMFGGLSESNQTCQVPNFTLVDPSCHWPSNALNFQVSSNFDAGKSMQAATNTSIIASSLRDNVLLPSSSKNLGKRTFDLELPADEYIDHEEERFEDGTVSGVSKAPDYAIKDLSAVCRQKDIQLSICKNQLNPSEGNSSGTNFIPSITNLADLNKTFQLNKEGTLYSTSLLPLDTSIIEEPHLEQSYSQKPKMAFQVQTKEINCVQIGKDLENRSEDLHVEKMSRQHEHTSSNHLMSSTKPFDTPASLSKNATLSIGNYCLNNNVCLSRNLTYDPRSASVGSLQNNLLYRLPAEDGDSSLMFSSHLSNLTNSFEMATTHGNEELDSTIQGSNWLGEKLVPGGISDKLKGSLSHDLGSRPSKEFLMSCSDVEPRWHGTSGILTNDQFAKSHPYISEVKVADNYEKIGILDRRPTPALTVSKLNWSAQNEMLKNGVYFKYQIDLNSSLNEDGSAHEDGSAQVEVETKSAADINLEPPVSPENKESSPPRGNSVEKQPTESVELTEEDDKCQKDLDLLAAEGLVLILSNSAQCLKWFAGVVSSAPNAQEEENGTVQGRVADSNHSELVADGLNNFAALTPRMEETKFEEYFFNSTGNKKRIAPATSSSLPKRKRTRRTKSQKAMQGDILPCITSPSRQEVSQKTHTISGLRKNEGKARFGKKKLSKNERQNGKKHNSKSTVLQHLMCSYPKQQTDDAKLDSLERCLPGWGRRNKRQTGQRRPAPNRALRLAVLRLKG